VQLEADELKNIMTMLIPVDYVHPEGSHIFFSSFFIYGFGRNDQGEKTPSSAPHPKHGSVAGSSYGAVVLLCMGGVGVWGFSRSA